jgi:hypothetical protein
MGTDSESVISVSSVFKQNLRQLLRLEVRDNIGDVLRGQAELLGAEHERAAERLLASAAGLAQGY